MMKYRKSLFVRALVLSIITAGSANGAGPDDQAAFFSSPKWLGQKHFAGENYKELDALIETLTVSGARADDGRYQLYLATSSIAEYASHLSADFDAGIARRVDEWNRQSPDSAFAPIVWAMLEHRRAWRARGGGFASTVTPEGWRLFRERAESAWKMIVAAKDASSRIPTWYEMAIAVGFDAQRPGAELNDLFSEGIARFPGYHPIYFAMIRGASPRWGGSYEYADEFIRAAVAAKTNPEGEILYARLYWLLDQLANGEDDLFQDSLVDWSRMLAGFEEMMRRCPDSKWNLANFAAFACRAGDGPTYLRLRKTLDAGVFNGAAPEGYSTEVCDARFTIAI